MPRLNVAQVRSRIAKVLGICSSDARVIEYLNAAVERLLNKGHWVGTTVRYQICTNEACLTWPREILTIEKAILCQTPMTIRNGWFEFLGNGPGLFKYDQYNGLVLADRNEHCCFDDVRGTGQKLALYADSASDAGKTVLLQFYDENGNKVRTDSGGTYYEGELITLVAPPAYAYTTNTCMKGGVYGVQKALTNYPVRLYCYDTVALTQYPLGYYEPSEVLPSYRRSFLPYIQELSACDDSAVGCESKQVTVMAKLRYIPVATDRDWLLIGNLPALEEMVQSVKESEPGGDDNKAILKEQKAIQYLQEELTAFEGAGATVTANFQEADTWGGGIENWN